MLYTLRITQLYEQGAEVGSVRADGVLIGKYVKRWTKWLRTGVYLRRCNIVFLIKFGNESWAEDFHLQVIVPCRAHQTKKQGHC
jgi:hypothetical protein